MQADLLRHFAGYATGGGEAPHEDKVASTKGLKVYHDMLRDPEVSAALTLKLSAAIPGVNILPGDSTPQGERAARLVSLVCLDLLPGSFLDVFRGQIYREAQVSGRSVVEPVQKVYQGVPGFGTVRGLAGLKVITGADIRIMVDDFGNVTGFKPSTLGSGQGIIPRDKLLYYAYQGTPHNRNGISALRPAYNWFYLKEKLSRLYAVFCTVNASGLRIGTIPDDEYYAKKDETLAALKGIAEYAAIVKPESQGLDIQIPPGQAGAHFIMGIRELCNKEIRKAILLDETLNAEGQHTGSYASKKVSQSLVYEAMAAEGAAFCEDLGGEQLFRLILAWNGMEDYPVPKCIPEPQAKKDEDLGPIMAGLSQAKSSGLFTINLPPEIQGQIASRWLEGAGIEWNPIEDGESLVDQIEDEEVPEPKPEKSPREEDRMATAPPGRRPSDIRRLKKEAEEAEKEGVRVFSGAWEELLPKILGKINASLFDRSGVWKSKDPTKIRKAIEASVTTGGQTLRQTLTDLGMSRYSQGFEDAEKMVRVAGAVGTSPIYLDPDAARAVLWNLAHLTLKQTYTGLEMKLYTAINSSLSGAASPRDTMFRVRTILEENGFPPGRATTIVNTSLSQAYNRGRMALFADNIDPTGQIPGSIVGVCFSAVMDAVTTDVCQSYDQKFFKADDPALPEPPLHHNCRSILIPVFAGETPWNETGEWTTRAESRELSSGIPEGFGGN